MKDIEKRALDMKLSIQGGYVPKESLKSYFLGELEKQRKIDIENCVKWCENFNKEAEETCCEQRIDVESFRKWITNMIMSDGND